MLNKVKRIAVMSLTILLLIAMVSIVVMAEQAANNSNTEAPGASANVLADVPASYQKAAENNRLILYVNPATLGIKVENKANGYVWNGTLDEKDDKLNQSWQSFFESGLTVEYMDSKRKIITAPVTGEQVNIAVVNIENGFSANVQYEEPGISLQMDVTLTGDAVEFKVPEASIKETNKDNRLQSLYMYPFLGATKGVQTDKGYMFIPDGSGALVSLNQQTIATQPYVGRVYGDDLGMKGGLSLSLSDSLALAPDQIYIPVFGITHQEGVNAFVSMITGGAPYSEIRSYPSGVTTVYNWTLAKWIYREQYFQPVDKKGKGVILNQEEKNKFDASLKVMLLTDDQADYSGMANRVQSELIQQGELPANKQDGTKSIPLHIEILAAESQKQMIGREVIPMTTLQQVDQMIDDLRANEVDRMVVVVRGWTKGGASGASPAHFPFEDKVGSSDDWKAFVEKYKTLGIPVYFFTDYVVVDKSAGGYGKVDIAQSVSKQLLSLYDRNVLQPSSTRKQFEHEISSFKKNGMENIALDSIGATLFSNYGKSASTRSQSMETYESMLSQHASGNIALYRPNQYLWKYTDRMMDMPMNSSGFLLETEQVPFLQLVLKGYVDYYSPASNFYANPQEELLRMIDYGSYPSFFLTNEDPIKLLNTGSSWLYTSQYSVWKDQIVKQYQTITDALQPVANATFDKREEVQEGVFRNRYSNGTVIYINYAVDAVTVDGIPIPAQGFLVKEGDQS